MKSKTQAIMAAFFTLILVMILPLLVASQSHVGPTTILNLTRERR